MSKFIITFVSLSAVDYIMEAEDEDDARLKAAEMIGTERLSQALNEYGCDTEVSEVLPISDDIYAIPDKFCVYEPTE